MTGMLVGGMALLGLCVGSFLNVVIWRLPRGLSIARPPSACPACDAPIRPRDNVPLLSWLLLRRRCRDCGVRISARYPAVELVTASLFVVMGLRWGVSAVLPAYLYLVAVGVALALIDLDTRRLPDALTLPSYVVAPVLLALAAVGGEGPRPLLRALLGMAALLGFYIALVVMYPSGMGLGDVKLAGVLGLYLAWIGWGTLVVGAFAGFLIGSIVGIGLIASRRGTRKSAVPFGPFMLLGTLVGILVGPALAGTYLHLTLGQAGG